MAKIRQDLKGVVVFGGRTYRAGDMVPAKVKLGAHVLEAVDSGAPKGSPRTQKKPPTETTAE